MFCSFYKYTFNVLMESGIKTKQNSNHGYHFEGSSFR